MSIQAASLLVEVGADTRDAERGIDGFNGRLENMTRAMTRAGVGLSASVTAPLVGLATAAFSVGSTFESAFAGVAKTVSATDEELATLRAGILNMSREVPLSASAIAGVAAAAGQLGIQTENILSFTRVMADLGVTTNLSAENAATALARFANITQMPQENFSRLGSTIVALGNNLATTESEIVEMGLRIAGAGAQIGLTEAQILGVAGALSSVGIEAEAGGSAISRVMIEMANAVATGGSKLSLMAEVAGTTSENFRKLFETNPAEALVSFIEGLNGISAAGGNVFGVLEQLGLSEIRVRDALLRAAGAGDLFRQSLTLASTAWRENVALSQEAALRYGTVESQLQLMANGLALVGITLYDRVRPLIVQTITAVNEGIGGLLTIAQTVSPSMLNAALAFTGVFAAAGPLLLVIGGLAAAFGFLISPLGLVITASAALAAAWAADVGGMQAITATAMSNVQQWLTTTATQLQQFGQSVATAFSNTSFPSLEVLWQQFRAGDFQTIADTIRNTTFDLMVNLDTELNITAQANQLKQQLIGAVTGLGTAISGIDFAAARTSMDGLRDNLLAGLTASIEGVDWGQGGATFAGLITSLSTSIQNLDFSTINWADVFQRVLLGPMGVALGALQWVVSSSEFEGLKTSVKGAIGTIDWGELGTAFAGLGTAIAGALGAVALDMAADVGALFAPLTQIKFPEININWGELALNTVDLVTSVTETINNTDWSSIGLNVGTAIFDAASLGVEGAKAAFLAVVSAGNWLEQVRISLLPSLVGWAAGIGVEIGTALKGINLLDVAVQLEASIKAAIVRMFIGAASQIGSELSFAFNLPTVDWAQYVGGFAWTDFIPNPLTWSTFVTAISWDTFVTSITWSSFIPNVTWDSIIPDFGWGDFVPDLDWGRFIPWLNLPGLGGGGDVPANASGTAYFPGGLSWVGERGPELVSLPRGTRIYSNDESMAMAAGGVTIQVYVERLANDIDLESLANKLARKFQQRIR